MYSFYRCGAACMHEYNLRMYHNPLLSTMQMVTQEVSFMSSVCLSFLAELFRGMLFKWKGANKKSHQK